MRSEIKSFLSATALNIVYFLIFSGIETWNYKRVSKLKDKLIELFNETLWGHRTCYTVSDSNDILLDIAVYRALMRRHSYCCAFLDPVCHQQRHQLRLSDVKECVCRDVTTRASQRALPFPLWPVLTLSSLHLCLSPHTYKSSSEKCDHVVT